MGRITGYRWNTGEYTGSPHVDPPELAGTVPAVTWTDDATRARQLLSSLNPNRVTALDTEFDPDDRDRIWVWSVSQGKTRICLDHSVLAACRWWLEDPEIPKALHHAYADVPVLRHNGIELRGVRADTMILDWLVDENRMRHGLKICGRDWLGIPMREFSDAFSIPVPGKSRRLLPPLPEIYAHQHKRLIDYASLDAYVTYWLYRHHWCVIKALGLVEYYQRYSLRLTEVLSAMHDRAVTIDAQVLREIRVELDVVLSRATRGFRAIAPTIVVTRKRKGQEVRDSIAPAEINMQSPQQMAALFYDTLKCPVVNRRAPRTTDVEAMQSWANRGNMLAQLVLQHRGAAKYKGTFIGEPNGAKGLWSKIAWEHDRYVVRTVLDQIGARTGRLSSRSPNLQQIPSRKEKDPYRIRRAFTACRVPGGMGYKLIVADLSMAEIRMMAHESRDKNLMRAIRDGQDVHSLTAVQILAARGITATPEDIKTKYPDDRNRAKAVNFGIAYGMQARLLASTLKVSEDEAQTYLDAYFQAYPGVYRWTRRIVEFAREHSHVRTLLGRYRWLHDIHSDDQYLAHHAENQAMNAPIQGGVADYMVAAMILLENDSFLREHECSLLLQVHDEVMLEAPEIDADVCAARIKEILEHAVPLRVPMVADVHVADNWEAAKG